ncbi:MAG TPA: hypothetical protein VKH44_13785 [Pirellulaceae bacterium]|nr:hypothetical protein [Pirellulaceae bacterium]
MTHNPILRELYEARDEILAEYGGDAAAYLRDAQKRLLKSGRPIATIKQRTIHRTEAAKPGVSAEESHSSPSGYR